MLGKTLCLSSHNTDMANLPVPASTTANSSQSRKRGVFEGRLLSDDLVWWFRSFPKPSSLIPEKMLIPGGSFLPLGQLWISPNLLKAFRLESKPILFLGRSLPPSGPRGKPRSYPLNISMAISDAVVKSIRTPRPDFRVR
jgi:hypothetical protein